MDSKDRGRIDQDGTRAGMSGDRTSQLGAGSLGYGQPNWNASPDQVRDQIDSLDKFVIVGTKDGQPFVASTGDKFQAQQLLREHVSDLIPQNA